MKLRANLVIGGTLFALAIFVGLLAPWLAHTDPVMDANLMNAEEPPSWRWCSRISRHATGRRAACS